MDGMTHPAPIDEAAAWAAFAARDRTADGRFVVAVATTNIYCRPSCPARRPRRENVTFYTSPAAARDAGYRACLRCLPDAVSRDRVALERACALIDAAEAPTSLAALAEEVGYAPHHFHRLFKRATGLTPAAWARGRRAARAAEALTDQGQVTDAIYRAGYQAPSRFYDDAGVRLGMTPSSWARGGAGETIRWVRADTSLGPLLIAATLRGLCRVSFEEDEAALAGRFPRATIERGDDRLAALAAAVVASVESPARDAELPLDLRGTAFQEAVWAALRSIPAGETRTYAELAALVGSPRATRAVGSACGANPVAVVVPCHRVTPASGGIGNYAYGASRKATLLARETR